MALEALDIQPCLGGVARRSAYQWQEPFFAEDAMNYWPRDPFEGRMRGGSRPGLVKAFPSAVTGPVHLLANVRAVETTGLTTFLSDFSTSIELPAYWTVAPWIGSMPGFYPNAYVYGSATRGVYPDFDAVGMVLPALGIKTTIATSGATIIYDLHLLVLPSLVQTFGTTTAYLPPDGTYSIFAQMDATNPNATVAGTEFRYTHTSGVALFEIYYNGSSLASSGAIAAFQQEAFLLTLRLSYLQTGSVYSATGYVNGSIIVPQATLPSPPTGERVGIGINSPRYSSEPGLAVLRRVGLFKIDYTASVDPSAADRNVVVAIGGTATGTDVNIVYEDTPGALVAAGTVGIGSDLTLDNPKARLLQGAELLGKLYIVGEDAEKIWRFDPAGTGSLISIVDVTETVVGDGTGYTPHATIASPVGCSAIVAWRNRLVVVERGDPQNVSMSRVGFPANWNYSSKPVGSALKLNTTGIDTGRIGEPIYAPIAHSDDYLLLGCLNSLFVLRGDPSFGGQVDRLSSAIGIVAAQAWARGPNGETVFLSTDGLYALSAGVLGYPESISRERLPQELRDIDTQNNRILMAYDVRNRGVFIGITPMLGGGGKYLWFDWEGKGFWPMEFDPNHEPTSLVYRTADSPIDQRLLLGCRDGSIRCMNDAAFTDDGLNYRTMLLEGPIALGGGGYNDGILVETIGQLGEGSGDVKLEIQVGNSIEAARKATPRNGYNLKAGKNLTNRPRLRGAACFLRYSTAGGVGWARENMTIVREKLGKQRLN